MPSLHSLCTDHAVLSARQPRVLGFSEPNALVTVEIAGATKSVRADAGGRWTLDLPALPPGGPHRLVARDASGEARADDVWFGDVWLGSGQSNMEWTLSQTKDSAADIASADEPRLRFYIVPRVQALEVPAADPKGRWQVCTPSTAPACSAVGYFFARRLIAETGRPAGFIVAAWGGSAIAPWLPPEVPGLRPEYETLRASLAEAANRQPSPDDFQPHADPGPAAHAADWASPGLDDSGWALLALPGLWQNSGWGFNGAAWFRRAVELPPGWIGRDLELRLGVVDDHDRTFVNGAPVGAIGGETPNWWTVPRVYRVPAALASGPRLVVAVRVFDAWGEGGVLGPISLRPAGATDAEALALHGPWRARAELELPLRSPGGPPLAPTALWNGMIAPLLGARLDGVLWYQGESDVTRAALYPRLLSDLIRAWRAAFGAPDLPFGIVQLAAYQAREDHPVESPWAELREAQRLVALHTPACGLALAIDAGEADDIHPRYKRVVGERLAAWALRRLHGRADIADSGPLPVETWRDGDGVRVRFTHAEGLRVRGGKPGEIALRGPDRRWVWADEVRVEGDTLFARATAVPAPKAIRHAWQTNPATTLENGAALPAAPFELRVS